MMKLFLSVGLSVLFFSLSGQATPGYENLSFISLKKLLDRQPSFTIPAGFHYERLSYVGKLHGEEVVAYRIQGPERLPGKNVFAVLMDGRLFVNPNKPRMTSRATFYQVEWMGNYGYFVDILDYEKWGEAESKIETVLREKIIDTATGKVRELTKKSLRKIIADEPDLLAEFDADRNKQRKLKDYLIRHQKKQSVLYLDYYSL